MNIKQTRPKGIILSAVLEKNKHTVLPKDGQLVVSFNEPEFSGFI